MYSEEYPNLAVMSIGFMLPGRDELNGISAALRQLEQSQLMHIDQALSASENYMPHLNHVLGDLDLDELQKMVLRDEAQRVMKQVNEYLQRESILSEQLSGVLLQLDGLSKGL